MKLEDILKIKAGTLIKGIRMEGDHIEERQTFLDLNGWLIEGMNLDDFVKSRPDETMRVAALTLVPDHAMVKDGIHEINDISDITSDKLTINTQLLLETFCSGSNFDWCCQGDLVGMSLGENVVSFTPSGPDIYRRDYYELVCWHRILIREKVSWLRMMSTEPLYAKTDLLLKQAGDALMGLE